MQLRGRRRLAVCLALPLMAIVMAAISCSRDATPEPTLPNGSALKSYVARPLSAKQRDRLKAAKVRTQWVGDAHHAGMQVVIKSIAHYKNANRSLPRKGSREYCAIIEKAGDAALSLLDEHGGLNRSRSERLGRIRNDRALDGCFSGTAAFGFPASVRLAMLWAVQDVDAEVTGVYENYLNSMDAAVQGSDGSVYSVQSRLDAVLALAVAGGVPEGDLLALTSFAALAVSSAEEWNNFDWSSLDTGTCTDYKDCNAATSFPQSQWDGRLLKIIGADGLGCFSTVTGWGALKTLLFGPAWPALAGECGFRGVLASGAAIMAMGGGRK